jgi:hypothetical protein
LIHDINDPANKTYNNRIIGRLSAKPPQGDLIKEYFVAFNVHDINEIGVIAMRNANFVKIESPYVNMDELTLESTTPTYDHLTTTVYLKSPDNGKDINNAFHNIRSYILAYSQVAVMRRIQQIQQIDSGCLVAIHCDAIYTTCDPNSIKTYRDWDLTYDNLPSHFKIPSDGLGTLNFHESAPARIVKTVWDTKTWISTTTISLPHGEKEIIMPEVVAPYSLFADNISQFTLSVGPPGCGKSRAFLMYPDPSTVFLTPTNLLMFNHCFNSKYPYMKTMTTYFKFFGFMVKNPTWRQRVVSNVVIDEATMIPRGTFKKIVDICQTYHMNLHILGDFNVRSINGKLEQTTDRLIGQMSPFSMNGTVRAADFKLVKTDNGNWAIPVRPMSAVVSMYDEKAPSKIGINLSASDLTFAPNDKGVAIQTLSHSFINRVSKHIDPSITINDISGFSTSTNWDPNNRRQTITESAFLDSLRTLSVDDQIAHVINYMISNGLNKNIIQAEDVVNQYALDDNGIVSVHTRGLIFNQQLTTQNMHATIKFEGGLPIDVSYDPHYDINDRSLKVRVVRPSKTLDKICGAKYHLPKGYIITLIGESAQAALPLTYFRSKCLGEELPKGAIFEAGYFVAIDSAQGATYENKVFVDLEKCARDNAFYTSITRVRELKNLYLIMFGECSRADDGINDALFPPEYWEADPEIPEEAEEEEDQY